MGKTGEKKYDMIGYTHIDPVWLWSRAEGMQEVKSSFASALDRMDEFEDFRFSQTSIAFLAWLKENCPWMFEKIKDRVREGRWEIQGGMWVEPDCDLPSGEALIRHFLYGKRFVQEEFGKEVTVGFNPDSFGHGANLPAILNGCGIYSYIASRPDKKTVPLPAMFIWKSPDGSRVTAERTGGEYMAWTRPALEFNLKESREGLEEIGYDRMAVFYGVGNHGGGPTIENIRTIYEMREEYPAGTLDFSTMEAFFKKVEPEKLPEVTGELGRIFYGCYSSDREIKQKNRRAEWTLQKAEAMSAMAAGLGVRSWKAPAEKLEYAWKEALFNQFHDVLAGTSIEPSRTQACREFDAAISIAEHVICDAVQAIANGLDTRGDGFPLVLFNPTGRDFSGVFAADVYVPRAQKKPLRMRDPKGEEIFCCETGYRNLTPESRKMILFEARIPAWGYSVYRVIGEGPNEMEQPPCIRATERMLDNGIVKVELDEATGCPSSLMKNGKETLGAPCSVRVFYDDRGAWGEDIWEEKPLGRFEAAKLRLVEANPLRAVIRALLNFERSELRIDYILEKGSDVLKLDVRLHNMEKHRQISLCVPVRADGPDVRTETAFLSEHKISCTDPNREHYQHRFADVSGEDGSGVSVINDGVYACQQVGSEYRLVLSRSSVHARGGKGPLSEDLENPFMDQGTWDYRIRMIGHDSAISNRRLFAEADLLHMPPEYLGDSCHPGERWQRTGRLLEAETEHAVISCVKQGLECPDELVVRAFETEGSGGSLQVRCGQRSWKTELSPFQIKTAKLTAEGFVECDLLERPAAEPAVKDTEPAAKDAAPAVKDAEPAAEGVRPEKEEQRGEDQLKRQ